MPTRSPAAGRRLGLLLCGGCTWVLTGCGGDAVKLVPVVGRITVDGTPLTTGSVSFRPDKAKGNASPHEPAGDIDAQGNYKLYTALKADTPKAGAPPGWYKVAVISAEPGVYPPRKFFIDPKYGNIRTSPLSVEVTEGAAPGAYDFKLSTK
jgi:hypothetical protein